MNTEELINEELQVQKDIFDKIDNNESFYFLSGAGSGKTYALVETIKYSIKNRMSFLDANNSQFACITYTNAAKNEIDERLYNTNYVYIGTIHSFLWDIIEPYKKELLSVHRENIIKLINNLHHDLFFNKEFDNKNSYKKFRSLTFDENNLLVKIASENANEFYSVFYGENRNFWDALGNVIGAELLVKLRSNKNEIERILKSIIKIARLKYCVKNIDLGNKEYSFITYNEKSRKEILHKNIIGHDTLINYSLSMVSKYPLLRQVIIDSFPHIYIDEYQDTHSQVIKIMDILLSYSKDNNMLFLLGLFGDPVQSIYSNNESLIKIENKIGYIYKNINRRSQSHIVNLINNIRGSHQAINQKTMKTSTDGSVYLSYHGKANLDEISYINDKINSVIDKWMITKDNKLTCMVLKNKTIAQLCGFSGLYESYCNIYTDRSSYLSYESINDDILSRDIIKLGFLPVNILKMAMPFFNVFYQESLTLSEIFSDKILDRYSLDEISVCLDFIRDNKCDSLHELISNLIIKSNDDSSLNKIYSDLANGWCDSDNIFNNIDEVVSYLSNSISSFPSEQLKEKVMLLLDTSFLEIYNWIRFILSIDIDEKIRFITCHGSKGLEFDNVISFIDDRFGRDVNKFSSLFDAGFNQINSINNEKTRNLLYVICSRAIKNLEVVLFKDGEDNGDLIIS